MLISKSSKTNPPKLSKVDLRNMKIVNQYTLKSIPQNIGFSQFGRYFFVNEESVSIFKSKGMIKINDLQMNNQDEEDDKNIIFDLK